MNNMTADFILRIGDGNNFNASSSKLIWGINSKKNTVARWFKSIAKEGDRLWFVKKNTKGQIVAVATFTGIKERILGPLIELTLTNKELGWDNKGDDCDTEVHYKDLYNLTNCDLYSEIKSPLTIRLYNPEKCKVDLPAEYPYIVRYSKITNSMSN
jgi:hypothetical protein